MLTDDKEWIAAEISALIAAREERLGARIAAIQTTLLSEFEGWKLPAIDPRVEAAALRTMDSELEALQED